MLYRGIAVSIVGLILTLAGFAVGWANGFATVEQMREGGVLKGLPIFWHEAMWSDLINISPMIGIIVVNCSSRWTVTEWLLAGAIGLAGSILMHYTYTMGNMAEAHVQNHRLTTAAIPHFFFMWMAISILLLFYFRTERQPWEFVWSCSALLIVHLIVATHIPMKVWSPEWFPEQQILDIPTVSVIVGCSVVLIWRSIAITR